MAEFLDQYEEWLRRNRQEHRPEVFRAWAVEGYCRPSRAGKSGRTILFLSWW